MSGRMNVGLLGYGIVGKGFYDVAKDDPDVNVSSLLTIGPIPQLTGTKIAKDIDDLLSSDIDTVVEAIGGLHPAFEFAKAAMESGKNYVTSNKNLVAAYYNELVDTAAKNNVAFRATAAVGGGIPWLTTLERAIRVERVLKIEGIMNGTSNFILDSMATKGTSFEDAIKDAQTQGFAEQDPTDDIEGYDAARKLIISSNIAFGCDLKLDQISIKGISGITQDDMIKAYSKGKIIKLIAKAELTDNGVIASVGPELCDLGTLEAGVSRNNNLISYYGEFSGKNTLSGEGAGAFPTGMNILRDCIDIINGKRTWYRVK